MQRFVLANLMTKQVKQTLRCSTVISVRLPS